MTREEILAKCTPGPNGCLFWNGAFNTTTPMASNGISVRQVLNPHIGLFSWATCGFKSCVSPGHTQFGSRKEWGIWHKSQKTHCKYGHNLAEVGTTKGTERNCAACQRNARQSDTAKQKQKARNKRWLFRRKIQYRDDLAFRKTLLQKQKNYYKSRFDSDPEFRDRIRKQKREQMRRARQRKEQEMKLLGKV